MSHGECALQTFFSRFGRISFIRDVHSVEFPFALRKMVLSKQHGTYDNGA
jgi:hypothetical protein